MTRDIKATVEELERLHKAYMAVCLTKGDCFEEYHPLEQFVLEHYPSLLAELRRLWAIEEAAVSLRDVRGEEQGCTDVDAREAAALDALFAALPPRKEGA